MPTESALAGETRLDGALSHERELNTAIHRQFLRSDVVQNLLRSLANSQVKPSISDADLKRLLQVVKDSRVRSIQSYLALGPPIFISFASRNNPTMQN